MNQDELFQTKSPSIQPFFPPLVCANPQRQNLSPLMESGIDPRRADYAFDHAFDHSNATTNVGGTTANSCSSGHITISAGTVAEFLSISRKYLGL